MSQRQRLSRRSALKSVGIVGAATLLGSECLGAASLKALAPPNQASRLRTEIFSKVWATPFIDTHEHLCDEQDRLQTDSASAGADDWTNVLWDYLGSNLLTAGMPKSAHARFYAKGAPPAEKWRLLEPYWPAVKNTGCGLAARISLRELYGVEALSAKAAEKAQAGYEEVRKPGFYRRILCDLGRIESCQVNWQAEPFLKSRMPTLLMQDLCILGMFAGPNLEMYGGPTGLRVSRLSDWHAVMDWWFTKYARYAVAVNSQNAYHRDIDYRQVPAEKVEDIFRKKLDGQRIDAAEQKDLEDHLFWHAMSKATENDLPVKLHTGVYAGQNRMPLSRVAHNATSACDLCKAAPEKPEFRVCSIADEGDLFLLSRPLVCPATRRYLDSPAVQLGNRRPALTISRTDHHGRSHEASRSVRAVRRSSQSAPCPGAARPWPSVVTPARLTSLVRRGLIQWTA